MSYTEDVLMNKGSETSCVPLAGSMFMCMNVRTYIHT